MNATLSVLGRLTLEGTARLDNALGLASTAACTLTAGSVVLGPPPCPKAAP